MSENKAQIGLEIVYSIRRYSGLLVITIIIVVVVVVGAAVPSFPSCSLAS